MKVPEDLWNRAKLSIARWAMATGERLNMNQLFNEGLEIRVEQLEKKMAKKDGTA